MIRPEVKKKLMQRFTKARNDLLLQYPFYGSLVMHLNLGLAEGNGTAFTDMKRIVFFCGFMERLGDPELLFVLEHEVMHCVLLHCVRGKNLNSALYNIACDIVVNSNIMQHMGVKSFRIDGADVMHLAPDRQEGYLYTAEQVYEMLLKKIPLKGGCGPGGDASADGTSDLSEDGCIDDHEIWEILKEDSVLEDQWKENLREAACGGYSPEEYPPSVRKVLLDLKHPSRCNWREILHQFVRIHTDTYDYTFLPPDRRFYDSEFVFPSFREIPEEAVEGIWFCVDTSGSVTDETLNEIFSEIGQALLQAERFSVKLSFFDTRVTEPVEFDMVETLMSMTARGGGGTSFHAIFKYMQENMSEKLPAAVIILTDGYAPVPEEKEAMGVPVLWMLTEEENEPDWGTVICL